MRRASRPRHRRRVANESIAFSLWPLSCACPRERRLTAPSYGSPSPNYQPSAAGLVSFVSSCESRIAPSAAHWIALSRRGRGSRSDRRAVPELFHLCLKTEVEAAGIEPASEPSRAPRSWARTHSNGHPRPPRSERVCPLPPSFVISRAPTPRRFMPFGAAPNRKRLRRDTTRPTWAARRTRLRAVVARRLGVEAQP